MRDYKLYLKDIVQAMENIESFISGMDFDSFTNDDKTASAVMRKLEIIGQARRTFSTGLPKNIFNLE